MARKPKVSRDPSYYEMPTLPSDSQARFDLLVTTIDNIVANHPGHIGELTPGARLFWQEIFTKITKEQWEAISLMGAQFRRTVVFFLTEIEGEVGFEGVYRIMLGPFAKEVKDRYEARFVEIVNDAEDRVIKARNECADAIMAKDREVKSAGENARFWHQHYEWAIEERDEARGLRAATVKEAEERIAEAKHATEQAQASESRTRSALYAAEQEVAELHAKLARIQAVATDRLQRENEERRLRLELESRLEGAQKVIDVMAESAGRKLEQGEVNAAAA